MNNPFIVAEMSGNHNGSLPRALEIIKAAHENGADAVKIQTYTADTITLDCESDGFVIKDEKSLWHGKKLYDLYQEAHTPWDWHQELFDFAKEIGITLFSSPFDETAVELLESLGNPIYKVASFELVDLPLIETMAKTGKPVVMSTGVATYDEIGDAIEVAKSAGCNDLTVLHCVSSYPAPIENTNLRTMMEIEKEFSVKTGISDHSLGIGVSVAACALGASFVEKHFTLSRSDGGVDSAFSMEPAEFSDLVTECKRASQAIGKVKFRRSPSENIIQRQFCRSLYISNDMNEGEIFTRENIRSVRPSNGLAPVYIKDFLGKKIKKSVKKGRPVSWDLIEN